MREDACNNATVVENISESKQWELFTNLSMRRHVTASESPFKARHELLKHTYKGASKDTSHTTHQWDKMEKSKNMTT